MNGLEVRTLVVGHRVVEVELETDDRPRSLGLSVRVDGAKRWSSEEPGWRDVGCGVDGEVFVWSARRLVVVSLEHEVEARVVDCDEDILAVFRVEDLWLLVCEASLRLVSDEVELSRLELPDVVSEARWGREDDVLIICSDETHLRAAAVAGRLEILQPGSDGAG